MEYAYQNSTIAQILEAIINESTFEGESNSNIGDILLSILNKTPYTEPPKSVIADLLLRVKAKIEGESFDPYEGDHISRIADILISILNETEYTEAPQSRIAELLLELKEELEAYTELTASGAIASFITNVVKPLVNGEFTIQAYQEGSGDPSPVNVRNIIGYNALNMYKTEENMFDPSYIIENGFINVTGGFQQAGGAFGAWNATDYIEVSGDTTYLFNPNSTGGNSAKHAFYNSEKGFISTIDSGEQIFTTPSGARYMRFSFRATSENIQLFEPEAKTKQLGETVYGGSYNSVSGKKTKSYAIVTLDGTETVRMGASNYIKSDACDGFVMLDYIKTGYSPSNPPPLAKCDKLRLSSAAIWSTVGFPNTWLINDIQIHFNIANDLLGITDYTQETTATAIAKIKEWLSNNKPSFLVPLAEPIETDIGATLIETFNGANNIFCDTGDTSVTYLYKGTPPETLNRMMSKGGGENNDIMKEEIKTEDEIEKPIDEEVNENEK